MIDDCYRLAHFYRQDPQVFLNKLMSDVRRDVYYTARLQKKIAEEQGADE